MGDVAPATPQDPEYVAPQGDPHGDEVLEGGPADSPEVPETPAGEAPPEPETPPAPPVEPEAPPVHKPDWRDKELGRRKRRLDEEVARATEFEARAKRAEDLAESLARQQPADPPDPAKPPPAPRQLSGERVYTQAELEAEADRRATVKANETAFKNDFDSAYRAGSSTFGKAKMDEAIARISELGGLDYDHLQMVLGTKDPGKVLYELGSKPEEFQRIMELPFNKRVAELVEMGLKTETPAKRPSNTPPPIEPLGGGGGPTDNRYNDKADDAAWFAAEEKRSALAWKKKQEGWRG